MKARLTAIVAALLLLPTGTATATTAARFDVAGGTMTFCLTPEVQSTFDEAGLRMTAVEPAVPAVRAVRADTISHQCVTMPVTGRSGLGMTESDLRFQGEFVIEGADGRALRFGGFRAETDEGALVSYAKANGRDDEITFFSRPLPAFAEGAATPLDLRSTGRTSSTEAVSNEFGHAFGAAVVEPGTEWLVVTLDARLAAA
ncbi:hypothetical protein ACQPW3_06225 [Actinosynnema sp. CA-248983]